MKILFNFFFLLFRMNTLDSKYVKKISGSNPGHWDQL